MLSQLPFSNMLVHSQAQLMQPNVSSMSTGFVVGCAHACSSLNSGLSQAESGSGRDMQIRFVRIIAIGMILVAATKIVPLMGRYLLCNAGCPVLVSNMHLLCS